MKDRARLKIAFISAFDTRDRKTLSGTTFFISSLLNKHFGDVDLIDNLRPALITLSSVLRNSFSEFTWLVLKEYSKKFALKIIGKNYLWGASLSVSRFYAKQINKRLKEESYDLIWAEKASQEIASLQTDIPIIYESDATFSRMVDYYPLFCNLSKAGIVNGNKVEQAALDKAKVFICTSEWTAASAVNVYGKDRNKIKTISRPAILDYVPVKEVVLRERSRDICNLLFVGVDWERKGGTIAVETVGWLNQQGIRAALYICGCVPPKKYFDNNFIKIFGFLDKSSSQESKILDGLYTDAHFLILPTRAECQGQVFCEAAAYALPAITTNTGGISAVVEDGGSGLLLDVRSDGKEFGEKIQALWEDVGRYNVMRNRARQLFEEKLSADKWVSAVKEVIDDTA